MTSIISRYNNFIIIMSKILVDIGTSSISHDKHSMIGVILSTAHVIIALEDVHCQPVG